MFQAPSPARQRVPVRTCTRVLRFGGAVVCRPCGTQCVGSAHLVFFHPLRKSIRTRRQAHILSSLRDSIWGCDGSPRVETRGYSHSTPAVSFRKCGRLRRHGLHPRRCLRQRRAGAVHHVHHVHCVHCVYCVYCVHCVHHKTRMQARRPRYETQDCLGGRSHGARVPPFGRASPDQWRQAYA